ncbi:GAF and ANTAR domain-containing protein [Streptomyces diacarni]|uniref:GAF and ANTAR domain-containing protein n=1 Tax=Streptomyces diacarni TaxID=2800381 RepID=UPI003406A642
MSSTGDACDTAHPDQARTEVVRLPGGASLWVVRVEGGLRDAHHPALSAATPPAPGPAAVLIDLALTPLVSAAGARALTSLAHDLAAGGTELLVATTDETIRRALGDEVTVVPGAPEATTTTPYTPAPAAGAGQDRTTAPATTAGTAGNARTAGKGGGATTSPAAAGPAARTSTGRTTGKADTGGQPTRSNAGTGPGVVTPIAGVHEGAEGPAGQDVEWLRSDVDRLRTEVRNLRAKARTHPLVSRAQGILEERYHLPDDRAAFQLMEASSQRFNVRLRTLATAVVTVPRPRSPHSDWFPGRERRVPPALAFEPGLRAASANSSEVLGAVLRRSMEITEATMGEVRLVDPVTGSLRLEKYRGLDEDFAEFFDRVDHTRADGAQTSCAEAARQGTRVTVTDVAADTVFAESAKRALLAAGSRGCHSTPLIAAPGQLQGVVSTHHAHPVRALTATQARALDEVGEQAGRWLDWYQRTVVLDALEDLHHRGGTWA